MAKENVIKFYEQLKADKASAEALKKAVAGATLDATIAFARERGFEFSREDLAAAEADATKELSPEQLDQVAAGSVCFGMGFGWGGKRAWSYCWVIGAGFARPREE